MPIVNFLWNPLNDNIVREFDDTGTLIAEYTTEANQFGNVVSQRRNGQDSVYHYDGQGSTLALTDANGDVTDTYAYSAFGEVTDYIGSTVNPFLYVGQKGYYRDDETGEYDVRRRLFTSDHDRWLSTDPLGSVVAQLRGYEYGLNRPLYFFDPTGMAFVCVGASAGAGFLLGIIPGPNLSVWGFGLSLSCGLYVCGGYNKALGWYCGPCVSCGITVTFGTGIFFSASVGPSVMFNFLPNTSNTPSQGLGIGLGVGGGLSLPNLFPTVGEITADIDLGSGDVTISVPKFGVGWGYYAAIRISGTCTACHPGIRGKLLSCLLAADKILKAAFQALLNGLWNPPGPIKIVLKGEAPNNGPDLGLPAPTE